MKKLLIIIFLVFSIFPSSISANPNDELIAAYSKSGTLWIKIGNKETRVTKEKYIKYPKWSFDGKWIAYLKSDNKDFYYEGDLYLHNIKTNKHIKVQTNVSKNFQWSPKSNEISFQINKTLYVYDMQGEKTTSVATNIENFSWLPNGQEILVSSRKSEELHTNIHLSKLIFKGKNKHPIVQHLFTIPVGKEEYYVSTSPFIWSHDNKWISFLLVPTASLSADANTLCILSHDGKIFQKIDEMLKYDEWFQWAPSVNQLGYISGVGREATSNKQLMILNVPSMKKRKFTPEGYVDRDFSWQNNRNVYVSRSKESEWAEIEKRPLPSLYKINIETKKHSKLTSPTKNKGDFEPQVSQNQLVWIRTDRNTANVNAAPIHTMKKKVWITNIDVGTSYYEKWSWDEVFGLY